MMQSTQNTSEGTHKLSFELFNHELFCSSLYKARSGFANGELDNGRRKRGAWAPHFSHIILLSTPSRLKEMTFLARESAP